MTIPDQPKLSALEDPQAWEQYWVKVRKYEASLRSKKYAGYRKEYYAKRTEERQKEKMKELIHKYPNEAKQIVREMLQSK